MASRVHILTLFLALSLLFGACSPRAMHEAEEVVAQADSLWQAGKIYGVDEGDSATLAMAYETMKKHSAFSRQFSEVCPFVHGTSSLCTYSHLCYQYGRLLRAKDDPVSAMRVFIDATHSCTRDFHILGRVYSNMGDLCHLAGDYPLSYDMFERSANCFLKNGDTINYFYALNDMAFELAEQGKKDSCFLIIKEIIVNNSNDSLLTAYSYMSQAQAYLRCQQYDSVIVYAYKSKCCYPSLYFGSMQLAQAYSHLGEKDSAAYYAKKIIATSHALSDINNALYILTNDDKTKNIEAVRLIAAERADTHKLLAIRQGELSQAVQLLELDLTRKPDWKWLMGIILTLVVIGSIIAIYVYRKRQKQELLKQKIEMLEKSANTIQEKKDELSERYLAEQQRIGNEIKERCQLLRNDSKLANTLAWNDFDSMCRIIDRQFYMLVSKLRNKHILNETETRLCILVLLELSRNEISQTLPYALNGVGKLKDHTAKKLGTTGKNLHDFLLKLAVEK